MSGKTYRHPSDVFRQSYTVDWVPEQGCYIAKCAAYPDLVARGAFPFTALISLECLIIEDYDEKLKAGAVNSGG